MPLKATRTFSVETQLPLTLEPLRELAYNLRWTWDVDTQRLFQDLAGGRWEALERNPVRLLQSLTSEQKERFAADEGLVARVAQARDSLEAYLARPRRMPVPELADGDVIAYFSLEFALAECLPNYSGGLGVLAGDHLKSASDLGLPLVGVGLLYRQGYFQQSLRPDGWQAEGYAENDFASQPVRPVREPSGAQMTISVPLDSREIRAAIWRVDVGQVPLFLLDADIPENSEADRGITGTLYGGDSEMRIQQEIVVGIGGIRALSALGLRPAVCHMNEGHSALLGLERIRGLMESAGASFDEARIAVAASSIFTTHTAVAAGIDLFPPELVKLQLGEYHRALGLDVEEFLGLGRLDALDATEPFSMALLGLRLSDTRNGVSRLHRGVAQQLWSGAWPGLAPEEIPIGSVTNGVHLPTWVSPEMAGIYDRHLGPEWRDNPSRDGLWEPVAQIPPHELWEAHESARNRMLDRARAAARYSAARATDQRQAGGLRELLQPGALTVGFARRFATYKRASLLFQNPERLARLMQDPERPIQFIFAGKAHPKDDAGKQLIREVVHFSLQPEFRNRILFVERYDVGLARDLVQGCDIWLNTPLRPLEASGTSGMKAVANGTLHMSVMDGWWHEAYVPGAGWAIGRNVIDDDPELQDAFDAESVYELLEDEALPLFYDRDPESGLPLGWLAAVARSIREYAPVYTTDRMVTEYAEAGYEPGAAAWNALVTDNLSRARSLAAWKQHVAAAWRSVRVLTVTDSAASGSGPTVASSTVEINVELELGDLAASDIAVDVVIGRATGSGSLEPAQTVRLHPESPTDAGRCSFRGSVVLNAAGGVGYAVRLMPCHPDLRDPGSLGLVRWA